MRVTELKYAHILCSGCSEAASLRYWTNHFCSQQKTWLQISVFLSFKVYEDKAVSCFLWFETIFQAQLIRCAMHCRQKIWQ